MREIKFRAWHKGNNEWVEVTKHFGLDGDGNMYLVSMLKPIVLMQSTGLFDKNGKAIFEGDIIGEESVYHFIEREGWKPSTGNWKIIGEKSQNFTGKGMEKYIAGYKLKLVEWKESSCGFEPFSDSDDNCGHCGGGLSPKSFEVIGSIYENPELLAQKK